MSKIQQFFAWRSQVVVEIPFSVSYCLNSLSKGLDVSSSGYWAREYSIHVTRLNRKMSDASVLIRGSYGLPAMRAELKFHATSKMSTTLEIDFRTTNFVRRLMMLVEISTIIFSLVFLPCTVFIVAFYFFTNQNGMNRMQTLLLESLEQSFGALSVKDPDDPSGQFASDS